MCAGNQPVLASHAGPGPREGYIPVDGAELYFREIGQGPPIVVLHGGPDFDHTYLLPDLDRLSDAFRLINYDQRGRGKSARDVRPADVSMQSEIEDLEALRDYFGLDSVALLGHSWGGVLAMEYAIQHADRVSHLILMNTAPASREDYLLFRRYRSEKTPADVAQLKTRSAGAEFKEGDPDAVADYYRVHYRATLRQQEHLDRLMKSLRSSFTKESILKGWEIEDRLMAETWLSSEYDLLPRLKGVNVPTLVIHGDYDFVPEECSAHIAQAIPGARLVLLRECGHFSYLERPDEVHEKIVDFFGSV